MLPKGQEYQCGGFLWLMVLPKFLAHPSTGSVRPLGWQLIMTLWQLKSLPWLNGQTCSRVKTSQKIWSKHQLQWLQVAKGFVMFVSFTLEGQVICPGPRNGRNGSDWGLGPPDFGSRALNPSPHPASLWGYERLASTTRLKCSKRWLWGYRMIKKMSCMLLGYFRNMWVLGWPPSWYLLVKWSPSRECRQGPEAAKVSTSTGHTRFMNGTSIGTPKAARSFRIFLAMSLVPWCCVIHSCPHLLQWFSH